MKSTSTVGILVYGSLIDDPGDEIKAAIVEVKSGIKTPFNVEFARRSMTRDGGPTLIPVSDGGTNVTGKIFVLSLPVDEAVNRLWRRETRKETGSKEAYHHTMKPGQNTVVVERLESFMGVDIVLYTRIAANITPLTPEALADFAIKSARTRADGTDGISYLMAAIRNDIITPLTGEYEAAIKSKLDTDTLDEALRKTRSSARPLSV